MIKFENTKVWGFQGALRGMRNQLPEWSEDYKAWKNSLPYWPELFGDADA